MFYKKRILKTVLLVVFIAGFCLNAAYAAWWDTNAIPVPEDSQKVDTQTRAIGKTKIELNYYSSTLSVDEIRDFYRKELAARDWKESNMLQSFSSSPELEKKPGAKDFFANNIIFEKDEKILYINFLPGGVYRDAKTRFTVGLWQKPAKGETAGGLPQLLKKPKKDVAPAYPGASLMSLSENENSLQAMYMAKDAPAEEIAAFYKQNMPGYGWSLTSEEPMHKVGLQGMNKYYTKAETGECPDCVKATEETAAQGLPEIAGAGDFFAGEMVFSNAKGDICQIVLSRGEFTFGGLGDMAGRIPKLTSITVHYEKKTE